MEQAGEIHGNSRVVTTSWADDPMRPTSPERQAGRPVYHPEGGETLSPLEAAQMKHEEAVEASKRERWAGQERWQGRENEEARLTRIMHPNEVFRRLRSAGVDARIESPVVTVWEPGRTGILQPMKIVRNTGRLWLNESPRVGRIGVNAWVRDEDTGRMRMQTVTTLQEPYGPEWSLMHFNKFGVLTAEKYRGWRTAMLALIFADVLTEEEVDRAFGPPALGTVSLFYRQQLRQRRNRKMGMTA